ncbi:MAG: LysM peptidoglycan-binding domain-containing protein [Gammaproteobacteria bacterium]
MALRTFFGFIVPFFFSMVSWAGEIKIKPSHPDRYTVVEGDTLWDIAGKFLEHPSQWPELWRYNPQITNPHQIYPGDTLYFSVVNGKPQLSFSKTEPLALSPSSIPSPSPPPSPCVLSEEDINGGRTGFALAQSGRLEPCIRESGIKESVKLIPSEAIAKYLSSPRVVSKNELVSAPYVVDFAGEHLIGGTGDKLYVRSITEPGSLAFTVYRAGDTYIDPETQEILGYEAKYIADATLLQSGDPATLEITKASSEIIIGDRVMTNLDEAVVLNYFPKPPEESIKGSIIGVLDGITQIGRYNVVVIDKGAADGLIAGHELAIYQRGRVTGDPMSPIKNDEVQLPDEISGTLMVFRPFERISYALVMQARQAIHVLDKVQTP